MSLIATFLFSCKGSSFLTQRYTKNKHSVVKKSQHVTPKENKSTAIAKENSNQQKAEVEKESITQYVGNQIKSMPWLAGMAEKIIPLSQKTASKNYADNKESVTTEKSMQVAGKTELESGKKIEKSKQSVTQKAIIGKLLKIIILILTIAVLLIIVGLLAALGVIKI